MNLHPESRLLHPAQLRPFILPVPIVLPILLAMLVLTPGDSARAQDLEPRALAPVPVGLNFAVLGYGYAEGNVFFDQSLPLEDATGKLHHVSGGYLRTLSFFGATAKLGAIVPYVWGDYEGLWQGEPASTSRRGFADPAVQLAVNFIGAPARPLKEWVKYREGTIVGASLMVTVPIGQYDPELLINLGSNRWAFRGRLGASHHVNRWYFELLGELWAFTENPEAVQNTTIEQDPLLAIQFSAIYQFKRGLWLGAGAGYGEGGQTTVSGVEKDTRQVNKRLCVTLAYPLNKNHSLKLVYLNSLSTVVGADFDKISLYWQVQWIGGP